MSDCTIRGGRIIDPANAIDIVADIAITHGKISAIGQNLPEGKEEVDAKGCIVCPGLIDIHAHVYEYATVLGVNPDVTCLARGEFGKLQVCLFVYSTPARRSEHVRPYTPVARAALTLTYRFL